MLVPTGRTVTTDFISEWGRVMRKKKTTDILDFMLNLWDCQREVIG